MKYKMKYIVGFWFIFLINRAYTGSSNKVVEEVSLDTLEMEILQERVALLKEKLALLEDMKKKEESHSSNAL